jgi:outer membrane protein
MRGLLAAALLVLVVSAAPAFGQTPAPAGQPAPQTAPPAPPAVFPEGAKVAFVNLAGIFQLSAEGKAGTTKVNEFTQKMQTELAEKTKTLQGAQQKLQTGATLMSADARAQLEKDIERQSRELERLQQDAQADLNDLQQELQADFQRKLFPLLEELAREKNLQMLFSAQDAGLIWADPGLDLTLEAVKKLDAAPAAPKP